MMNKTLAMACCFAAVLPVRGLAADGAITMERLLDDMTNLAAMAEFPDPAYTCRQSSSRAPESKTPSDAKGWFANGDSGHFVRVEKTGAKPQFVMLDVDGPGSIVRIWSAKAMGTIRIYIDETNTPAIEAPMAELLSGKFAGFPAPIASIRSKGYNLNVPIPYARHCKVVGEDCAGLYFHVNYRTYPAGTPTESFSAESLSALGPWLASVAAALASPGALNGAPDNATTAAFKTTVPPVGSETLASLAGGAGSAVRLFRLDWTPTGNRDEPTLRAAVLAMTFDGEQTVEMPLGDFFGTGPGVNPYEALPFTVASNGTMSCRWVMPFRTSARIEVRNFGTNALPLRGSVVTTPYVWTRDTMLFHAKWRIQNELCTQPRVDFNCLATKGQGVLAGLALALDNPVPMWWGEGDEKIYVDGEGFPSTFGTGTEDYFGYAYCNTTPFTHAYHAQPRSDCDRASFVGRISNNRFHILDRIPFGQDLRFDLEIWHWRRCNVNVAATAYWYARPGATDAFAALKAGDVALHGLPDSLGVKGAIEGERMRVIEAEGKTVFAGLHSASGAGFLLWPARKAGKKLVLGFDLPAAVTAHVIGRFQTEGNAGIVEMEIDGQKMPAPLDLFHKGTAWEEIDLGEFRLKQGENVLTVTMVGANPQGGKQCTFSLDYLALRQGDAETKKEVAKRTE